MGESLDWCREPGPRPTRHDPVHALDEWKRVRGRCHTDGVGHTHHHHPFERVRVPAHIRRLLTAAVAPLVAATVVGLVVLWPDGEGVNLPGAGVPAEQLGAVVRNVASSPCPDFPGQENFSCSEVTVEVTEGADSGHTFSFQYSTGRNARTLEEGDRVVVARSEEAAQGQGDRASEYFFVDFQRDRPLLLLAAIFTVAVVALGRWRGLAALAGLVVSLFILIKFVLPAILEGENPMLVACVGGAAIMLLALYLAHGINAGTTIAVLGTFASLLLTGVLAIIFVAASAFTGFGSEEATFLQISQQQVNLEGLLLASIIIGTLGVLDDVTVTQSSAVWELHRANPSLGIRALYTSGIRIGRDHIASTVNTLVLAYAGASLPLLILFSLSGRTLAQVLTTEVVAEEVVRTLVGSVGLVASVPVTTGLAAFVVTRAAGRTRRSGADATGYDDDAFRPRAEREWRSL